MSSTGPRKKPRSQTAGQQNAKTSQSRAPVPTAKSNDLQPASALAVTTQGIYSNRRFLTSCVALHGNVCQVKLDTNKVYEGIMIAVSPTFEVCLKYAHLVDPQNPDSIDHKAVEDLLFLQAQDIVAISFDSVNFEDAFKGTDAFATDTEISARYNGDANDEGLKELQPWDEPLKDVEELSLEENANGWDPNEMFRKNKEAFNIRSSYDHSMSQYTVPLERRDTDDFRQNELRAQRIAAEIESAPEHRKRAELENGTGVGDEEDAFSAVVREKPGTGNETESPARDGSPANNTATTTSAKYNPPHARKAAGQQQKRPLSSSGPSSLPQTSQPPPATEPCPVPAPSLRGRPPSAGPASASSNDRNASPMVKTPADPPPVVQPPTTPYATPTYCHPSPVTQTTPSSTVKSHPAQVPSPGTQSGSANGGSPPTGSDPAKGGAREGPLPQRQAAAERREQRSTAATGPPSAEGAKRKSDGAPPAASGPPQARAAAGRNSSPAVEDARPDGPSSDTTTAAGGPPKDARNKQMEQSLKNFRDDFKLGTSAAPAPSSGGPASSRPPPSSHPSSQQQGGRHPPQPSAQDDQRKGQAPTATDANPSPPPPNPSSRPPSGAAQATPSSAEVAKKSALNPNAKEFVLNPNAKSFTPRTPNQSATPPRPSTPGTPNTTMGMGGPGPVMGLPHPMQPMPPNGAHPTYIVAPIPPGAPGPFQYVISQGNPVGFGGYPGAMQTNTGAPPVPGPGSAFPKPPRYNKNGPHGHRNDQSSLPHQVAAATGPPLMAPNPGPGGSMQVYMNMPGAGGPLPQFHQYMIPSPGMISPAHLPQGTPVSFSPVVSAAMSMGGGGPPDNRGEPVPLSTMGPQVFTSSAGGQVYTHSIHTGPMVTSSGLGGGPMGTPPGQGGGPHPMGGGGPQGIPVSSSASMQGGPPMHQPHGGAKNYVFLHSYSGTPHRGAPVSMGGGMGGGPSGGMHTPGGGPNPGGNIQMFLPAGGHHPWYPVQQQMRPLTPQFPIQAAQSPPVQGGPPGGAPGGGPQGPMGHPQTGIMQFPYSSYITGAPFGGANGPPSGGGPQGGPPHHGN
ncbi:unnamed protein product [Cyprideis torosa]|uniref:Uncharacterized protein n=1 Tax=Cyprideis torosa TaxID=163714 RepID=A0A7R8W0I6_9CRUS|nr:unnamed protein product [Cyprideis torosa]CAG0879603.1 unnamed protein product [Cyprideis torosa]